MSESRNSSSWQGWALGVMGTLLLLVSSMYMTNLNADVLRLKDNDAVITAKQSDQGERLATVEEAVKSINRLEQSIKDLTNALNQSTRRNPQ